MPAGPGVNMLLCLLSVSCKPLEAKPPESTTPLPTKLDMPLLKELVMDAPLQNHVTSPFLISMLMSQLWMGARGSTRDEMTPTLGLSSSHMSAYRSALWKLRNAETGVTTSVFNRVYHISSFTIKPAYLSELSTYYGSAPKVLPSDTVAGAKEINDLASEKTQGNIKDLVTPGDLNRVVMVLFGAIYFKGTWLYRFNTTDEKKNFLTPSGEKPVTMMKLRTKMLMRNFKDFQAVALPYKDEDYSLVVLQPVKRTLAAVRALQNTLHSLDINQIYGELYKQEVELTMPRFKVEAKYQMPKYFKNLGIKKIFGNDADFSGISRGNIFVTDIIQKAMMEVNEEGTKAAAAAVVLVAYRSSGGHVSRIEVNKPFYAFVYHKQLKTVLFGGQVVDPS